MKKLINKIFLIIFIAVVSFSSLTQNVVAGSHTDTTGGYTITASDDKDEATKLTGRKTGTTTSGSNVGVTYYKDGVESTTTYYMHSSGKYPIYCLDPDLSGGTTGNLYANRFLFYDQQTLKESSRNNLFYAMDVAFSSAIKNGSMQFSSSAANASNAEMASYTATTFAIRAIEMLWNGATGGYGSGDTYSGGRDFNEALANTVAEWARDPEVQGYINAIKGNTDYQSDANFGNVANRGSSNTYFSGSTIDRAKSLFISALREAAQHSEKIANAGNSGMEVDLSNATGIPNSDRKVEQRTEGDYVTGVISHTFSVKMPDVINDDDKFTFYISGIDLGGSRDKYGLAKDPGVSKIVVNGMEICGSVEACAGTANQNLLAGLSLSGSETFNIVIEVQVEGYTKANEGYSVQTLNCDDSNINYKLNVKFGNENGKGSADYSDAEKFRGTIWYNESSSAAGTGTDYQRFISDDGERTIDPNGDGDGDSGLDGDSPEGEIVLNDKCAECEELAEKCEQSGNLNSDECKDLTERAMECGCEALDMLCQMELDSGISIAEAHRCTLLLNTEGCLSCTSDDGSLNLKDLCETSKQQGYEGNSLYCDKYEEENCATCEELIDKCAQGDEDACNDYEEEHCDECAQMFDACIRSRNINSPACQLYKRNKGRLNCYEDCNEWSQLCSIGDRESCENYERENCGNASTTECGTDIVPITECCVGNEVVADPPFNTTVSMMGDNGQFYEIHGVKQDKIKLCFVDKVDNKEQPVDDSPSHNSYQMLTDSRVVGNQFCKVNCREDYALNFPVAQRVNAGRYFTFQMSMESHKQCFTNTIDREKYKEIIEELLRRIETDATQYSYNYKAWENAEKNPERTFDTSCTPGTYCSSCGTTGDPYTITEDNNGGHSEFEYTDVKIMIHVDYDRVDLEASPESIITAGSEYDEAEVNMTDCTGYSTVTLEDGTSYCTSCNGSYASSWKEHPFEEWKQHFKDLADAYEADYYAAISELNAVVREYNNCSDWESQYNQDPDVKYDYDEEIYRAKAHMPVKMNGQFDITGESYEYCNLEWKFNQDKVKVDNKYEDCIGGDGFGGKDTDQLKYTECTLSGGMSYCRIQEHTLAKSIYKKSNHDGEGSYVPQDLFYNVYPSGNIIVSGEAGMNKAVLLPQKLPVALSTPKGVHNYYINVTNIGEFYNDGSLGRFAGSNSSKAVIGQSIDYTCAYLVNIPVTAATITCDVFPGGCEGEECISNCVGAGCEDLLCEGIECVTDCVGIGCIYDHKAGTSIYQRKVSLNELFPNGTDAYNWLNTKGQQAKSEIESNGNSIYDGTPVLSVTITPSVSRSIKDYNDSQSNSGGYSNDTITCQDIGGYQKLACYSSFITDLINGRYGNANTKVDSSRGSSAYFELWSGTLSEPDMLGPSYR